MPSRLDVGAVVSSPRPIIIARVLACPPPMKRFNLDEARLGATMPGLKGDRDGNLTT